MNWKNNCGNIRSSIHGCIRAPENSKKIANERDDKKMNKAQKRPTMTKVLSMILALIMVLSLLPLSGFTADNSEPSTQASTTEGYYKILHLDCGRKYFSEDWIIALLNEMKADGYNQLQLAFGNDGLRFLLDDMSFTANGTTYSHDTVVSKVEAGNETQNTSGDKRWLTQTQMDNIIAKAKELGIEIVPLLNLPGHANAILDIADDAYNATVDGIVSQNTLNVTNENACNFGYEIFKKYVDYFSGKGCNFFNFGADEYANDIKEARAFSFSNLSDAQYQKFVGFINNLADYIKTKTVNGESMTPRAFNDGLYYDGKTASIDTNIQCCYWSQGWSGYNLASAPTIASKHDMINTHGDYYYVVGDEKPIKTNYNYAAGFDNTVFAHKSDNTGIVSSPVGSMFCIWCDFPSEETETEVAQNVRLAMRAMALRMDNQSIDNMDTSVVTNGFNADGTLNRAATGDNDTYKNVDITLTVGQPSDIYKQDGDVTKKVNKDDFDETVASIVGLDYKQEEGTKKNVLGDKVSMSTDGTYTGVISDGTNYMIVNSSGISSTTDIDKATKFTVVRTTSNSWWSVTTTYTIKSDDGQYLTVTKSGRTYTLSTTTSAANWSYSSTSGFYDNSYSRYINYSNGWSVKSSSGNGFLYSVATKGTDPVNETQIVFEGKAVGNTSVIIGNVKYNITVTAEDLSKVTPLKLEYWITNSSIKTVTGAEFVSRTNIKSETYSAYYTPVKATLAGVATEDGIDVTKIAPPTTKQNESDRDLYYWRCRLLDNTVTNNYGSKTEWQTNDGGDDDTQSGVGFTKIRYYGSQWQVFTENNEWVNVDESKHQLVAYYLEYIKVSDEVESYAADWGGRGNGDAGPWVNPSDYCTLSMQVVYEDGTTNPSGTDASSLATKTMVYGYWSQGRGIGSVLLNGTEYEIYKVTAETGASNVTIKNNSNATVNSFTWDGNEETVWEGQSSNVMISNSSNNPSKEGANANLVWDENYEAILLRVYVKAKVTEDSLTVHYMDRTNNNEEFYSYNIAVAKGTYFKSNITLPTTDKGDLINSEVTNINNVTQTISTDLSKMPEINAKYRYQIYKCVEVTQNPETNSKDVYLYYTFSNQTSFVIDFGLPVKIPFTSLGELASAQSITKVEVSGAEFGTTDYDSTKRVITYTPTSVLTKSEKLNITVSGQITYTNENNQSVTKEGTVTFIVTIIPASNVYYEDSFATFTNADKSTGINADNQNVNGYWTTVGTTQEATQALSTLGSGKIYGYDEAYKSSTEYSMGSATKVTVDAETSKLGQSPTATFTFKGTGFDVISLTDNKSGTVMYTVRNTDTGEQYSKLVNTYYGYKYEDGEWTKTDSANPNALYQIPVIKENVDYGTYEVTISVLYGEYFNSTGNDYYSFWLDAIRVYNPMGEYDDYTKDNEGYPQYIKLHDELAAEDGSVKTNDKLLFIDGAEKAEIGLYANYGPNNEVYLANGQAITFKIPDVDDIASVQIGAKTPNGNATMKVTVNGAVKTHEIIGTATEMYYKLDAIRGQQIVITNNDANILSLTNLKITFTTKQSDTVTLPALTAEDQANAVATVRALFTAPTPEVKTFEPERFDASWNSVRVGQKATLTVKTSADVEAITVNGETVDNYKTRYERSGWGWWAEKVEYRVFTYTVTATETMDYEVAAVNAEGTASEPVICTLTVKPAQTNWWDDIWNGFFGKWF